ncbi:MAG: iron transporter [Pseudomonadota bacterium]
MATAKRSRHSRWTIAGRAATAILLGYVFANSAGLLLALALPVDRITGVLTGTIASFLLWGAAIMWAFSVTKTRTALLGLSSSITLCAGGAYGLYLLGGTA